MSRKLDYKPEYRRNLPHIQPEGATLFVTIRLSGSLPEVAVQQLKEEWQLRQRAIDGIVAPDDIKRGLLYDEEKRLFGRYDALLDSGANGPTWLEQPRVGVMVCDAIRYLDGRQYDLMSYCLMPNHAHLVFAPLPLDKDRYYALAKIMHGLKGFTAREANRILGRKGAFWQHESYDHYARDGREVERIVAYVLNNPVKAGLASSWEEWPWSYWKHTS